MSNNPLVPTALVAHLQEVFPNRLPPLGTTMSQILFAQGQLSVVEYLTRLHIEQFEKEE